MSGEGVACFLADLHTLVGMYVGVHSMYSPVLLLLQLAVDCTGEEDQMVISLLIW